MVFALSQNEILSVSDLDFHNTLLHYVPLTPAFVIYCHTSPQRGSIKGGFENIKTRGLPRPVTTTRRLDFHIKPPQLLPLIDLQFLALSKKGNLDWISLSV